MTTAIILAGGLGTRLREAVPNLPKPMAPINGRPFLEVQMDYWIKQGIQKFIISVGYLHEIITNHFGSNYNGVPIEYVIEKIPLGTGGALLLALKKVNNPFLLINGDTFFDVELSTLLKFHDNKKSDWTFALFRTSNVERYMGMQVRDDGRILSFKSDSESELEMLSNGGVYLVNPQILKHFSTIVGSNVSLENDVLPSILASNGAFYGIEFQGRFIDIGIPADYLRTGELLL